MFYNLFFGEAELFGSRGSGSGFRGRGSGVWFWGSGVRVVFWGSGVGGRVLGVGGRVLGVGGRVLGVGVGVVVLFSETSFCNSELFFIKDQEPMSNNAYITHSFL